jgi:hypothetical protein
VVGFFFFFFSAGLTLARPDFLCSSIRLLGSP